MNDFSKGREKNMLKNKNVIVISMLLILISAAAMMAAEGGSAKFAVTRPLFVGGNEIPIGTYEVRWEAGTQETMVTFAGIGKSVLIKVKGKIEEVDKKSDYNSLVVGKDSAGREAIKQLQFSGKNLRIAFE